jgi:polyhydroxyalkanoate synthesis regulator phasin
MGIIFLVGCTESQSTTNQPSLDKLEKQVTELQTRVATLEGQLNQANTLQSRVSAIEKELDWGPNNVPDLLRIDHLERQVGELEHKLLWQ